MIGPGIMNYDSALVLFVVLSGSLKQNLYKYLGWRRKFGCLLVDGVQNVKWSGAAAPYTRMGTVFKVIPL